MVKDEPFVDLFNEIASLWEAAPAPQNVPHRDGSRLTWTTAATTAVAWGWLVRVIRTGESAILLAKNGLGPEAAPLMRSIIEHSIRLAYTADAGVEAIEVGLRERSHSLEKLKKAQSNGWALPPERLSEIDWMQAEASEEYRHLDSFAHLAHVVKRLPSLGQLYMAWLLETQFSHPTLISAQSYFERDDDSHLIRLRTRAKAEADNRVDAQVCINVLVALRAYAHIAGLNPYFITPLHELDQKMENLWTATRESRDTQS
ncbi:hypothetical protein FFF93_001515 [Arthrobacter sp. KBS0702]|uniref:DUF5677 domain-containing protein n=1 Tax=Arthrobacter sp. KBS0702 TaxID=2578107 RepID=UPI00110DFF8F|nr:DUF5677 domain-containing protein [Arthrobacter sp. KBS0702]QDW28608.1 hypothetical protein FFF93_001515 [Arthrobacter sp. KBS0702]